MTPPSCWSSLAVGRIACAKSRRRETGRPLARSSRRRSGRPTNTMHCHCCHTVVTLARMILIREVDGDPDPDVLPAFATAFVCQPCYQVLDTVDAVGPIDGTMYELEERSRFGQAALF